MNKHKLVPAGPTDDELIAWAGEEQFFLFCDRDEFLQIARAVMQRYAAPQPTEQQPDMDQLGGFLAWLDAFVAVSAQAGIDDHEEAWTWPAPPTDPGFFDSYPQLTAGDLRAVHAALAAHRKGAQP